jgi:hypothetical protein
MNLTKVGSALIVGTIEEPLITLNNDEEAEALALAIFSKLAFDRPTDQDQASYFLKVSTLFQQAAAAVRKTNEKGIDEDTYRTAFQALGAICQIWDVGLDKALQSYATRAERIEAEVLTAADSHVKPLIHNHPQWDVGRKAMLAYLTRTTLKIAESTKKIVKQSTSISLEFPGPKFLIEPIFVQVAQDTFYKQATALQPVQVPTDLTRAARNWARATIGAIIAHGVRNKDVAEVVILENDNLRRVPMSALTSSARIALPIA